MSLNNSTKYLFITLLLLACNRGIDNTKDTNLDSSEKKANVETPKKTTNSLSEMDEEEQSLIINNYLIKNRPNSNFILIDSNSGVFIPMSASEIKKLKKIYGEDFYIISDDNIFYNFEAVEFLEARKVRILNPETRYLIFKMKNGKELYFDTQSEFNCAWKTILFNIDSLPKIIYPINIKDEYSRYFGNK